MIDWQQTASFVIAFGGVGAFIDFLLGKQGQAKIRGNLESFWISIAYVNVRTFARAEAATAHTILVRMFGTFFSKRRVAAVALLLIASTAIWLIFATINFDRYFLRNEKDKFTDWLFVSEYYALSGQLWIAIPLLWVSISATIWIAKIASQGIASNIWTNSLLFLCLIFLQLSVFPLTYVTTYAVGIALNDDLGSDAAISWFLASVKNVPDRVFSTSVLSVVEYPWVPTGRIPWLDYRVFILNILNSFPGVLRLTTAGAFLLSVFARPIHRTLLLLIQRLVESDKPIFTVVFAGGAAIAKFLQTVF